MNAADVRWLSPELAVAGLGLIVILLDLVVRRKGILALVTVVGLLVPIGLSVWLWIDVNDEPGRQALRIFDTLAVDQFALFFKFLVLGIVALIVLASADYVRKMGKYQGEYYGLILFSATGMMLLASTQELISIYISLELTTLPLAALAAFLMNARSSEAGLKFLILGAISSALLLYGMALIFGFTGSTYLPEISQRIGQSIPAGESFAESFVLVLGIVLMVAGLGFKISSVPFQMWVPDVYEGAPTPVAAYLSVASKAAGFAVLLRVFYTAFEADAFQVDWGMLFAVLAAASMTVGNLVAMVQGNIKRLLGYSTIAHAGYILVGLAAVAAATGTDRAIGPSSVLFYLGAYAFTNLAAFFAIIAICNKTDSDQIDSFAGMGQRAPYLAFALALALVALIGIPPTGIFIAKVYIFSAAIQSDLVWLAIVGVANSVISAYYYLRVIRTMYLDPAPSPEGVPSSRPFRLALGVSALGIVAFGVFPPPLLKMAELAVDTLPTVAGVVTVVPSP